MPYCPNCREEYIDSVTTCSVCGAELVAELPEAPELDESFVKSEGMWPDNWPDGDDGKPERSALLLDTVSETELNSSLMTLRGYGMPCFAVASNGAIVSPVVFGFNILGGKLFVPSPLLDDARELLSPSPLGGNFDIREEDQ